MRSWALATSALLLSCGCAATELDTPPDHPASSRQRSAAPEIDTSLLGASYDPFEAEPSDGAEHAEHAEHAGHGAHAGAPAGDAGAAPLGGSFTCPMHPEIVRPSAGRCPKCGMKLVPKKAAPP